MELKTVTIIVEKSQKVLGPMKKASTDDSNRLCPNYHYSVDVFDNVQKQNNQKTCEPKEIPCGDDQNEVLVSESGRTK